MGALKRMLKSWGWHLLPWAGLIGGGFGWALTHQIGANLVQDRCQAGGPLTLALLGLLGLAVAAAGAFFSWSLWRKQDAAQATRTFLAALGLLAAALFSVAILFQTIAGFVIPRCLG